MKQLLLIIGMPGSGKDTQIEFLAKRREFKVIRIGDLVREKAKTNSRLAGILEAGDLVDNDIVNNLVKDALSTSPEGGYIISDGFPRDLPQAEWLDRYLSANDCEIDKVLLIEIDDATASERLKLRGRHDDDKATIEHRLNVFHNETDEVIDYYQNSGKLVNVDGKPNPDTVAKSIQEALGW